MGNANPINMAPVKPNPNGRPTTITKVHCPKCDYKRIVEQEGENCPNGCDEPKPKKAATKKAATKKAAPPAKTENPEK